MRKTEEEIRELIKEIENADTVLKENRIGLTEITSKGNNWIEALKWSLGEN